MAALKQFNRAFFHDFWQLVKPYWSESEERWSARGPIALVIGLNLLMVYISYRITEWYNTFYNALQQYDAGAAWPQKPYLPLGSLREVLLYPYGDPDAAETEISAVIDLAGLSPLTERLAETRLWSQVLSLGEQQRVAFARIPPAAALDSHGRGNLGSRRAGGSRALRDTAPRAAAVRRRQRRPPFEPARVP